jgi:hypothetical protein
MPPTLSISKSLGSIRKSHRVAELQVENIRKKEAAEFFDAILDMHQQELKEAQNQKLISNKNDAAVEPLNNPVFISQPYNIIVPGAGVPGAFTVSTSTFLDILNWEGKTTGIQYPGIISPPTSTLGIRKPFDDFNDVLKKDQGIKGEAVTLVSNTADICKLSRSKYPVIETHRQGKRELQKSYQYMCFYCGRQIDVKDPGSAYPILLNTQCDHIFPIASALISLKRNANLIYNFQSVHKTCNGHASAMTIDTIWNKIGTAEFTKLNPSSQWCVFTLDSLPTTTQVNTREWCRGYLSLLLNKLTIVDSQEQMIRKQIFEKVIQSYQIYKDEVRLLMEDNVAEAVQYLSLLSSRGTQSFGSPENTIELTSIKKLKGDEKKYEAFFLVNGKQKTQKFGAEGMSDYTIHKDIDRRNRYISRHLKDLNTEDPMRAGYLSMFVLWNKPSFIASLKDYKTRLNIYNQTGKFPTSITGYSKLSNFGTPTNVVNKTLYKKVKEQIKIGIKGRRWGAYDSGRLVQMYKQLGGKYSGTKKETPLERWYKEKWVNACKWPQVVPCGRSDMTNKMAYCRPSVKVTKNTPKTVQSLTQAQINKRCTIKEKTPLVRITGKLKA